MSLTLKVRLRIAELQLSGMYAGIPFATGEPSPALPEGEERRREGVGEQVEVVGGQGLRTKAVGGWESSRYWTVYKFFASQSLHNRNFLKKTIRRCK